MLDNPIETMLLQVDQAHITMVIRFWTKEQDTYLKDNYNDRVKVSPAILAWNLGCILKQVINRMSVLGIRKRINTERY